jgi:hypothetical protein
MGFSESVIYLPRLGRRSSWLNALMNSINYRHMGSTLPSPTMPLTSIRATILEFLATMEVGLRWRVREEAPGSDAEDEDERRGVDDQGGDELGLGRECVNRTTRLQRKEGGARLGRGRGRGRNGDGPKSGARSRCPVHVFVFLVLFCFVFCFSRGRMRPPH